MEIHTDRSTFGRPYKLLLSDCKVLTAVIKERLELIEQMLNDNAEFKQDFSSRKEAMAHERILLETASMAGDLTSKTNMIISLVHRTFDIEKYAKTDEKPAVKMEESDGN